MSPEFEYANHHVPEVGDSIVCVKNPEMKKVPELEVGMKATVTRAYPDRSRIQVRYEDGFSQSVPQSYFDLTSRAKKTTTPKESAVPNDIRYQCGNEIEIRDRVICVKNNPADVMPFTPLGTQGMVVEIDPHLSTIKVKCADHICASPYSAFMLLSRDKDQPAATCVEADLYDRIEQIAHEINATRIQIIACFQGLVANCPTEYGAKLIFNLATKYDDLLDKLEDRLFDLRPGKKG